MKPCFKVMLMMALTTCIITVNIQPSFAQGASSSVSKQDMLTRPEYYFQRVKYFSEVTGMKGKYKVFNSGSEGMFHPLYVPVHKGVRRIGVIPLVEHYYEHIGMPAKKADPVKMAFLERLVNDSRLYSNLKLVNIMSSHINDTNLKIDKSGGPLNRVNKIRDLYRVGQYYAPKMHMQSLAAGLFSPEKYAKYFCSETEQCIEKNWVGRGIFKWGGGTADEFRAHKSYSEFVENQVAKIKLWACQLNHSVYVVGTALLSEYDFDKQGFYLSLAPPRNHLTSGAIHHIYMPRNKGEIILGPNKRIFFPLNEEKAEKLSTSHDKFYYAIKAEIYGYRSAPRSKFPDVFYIGVYPTFDLVGDRIEIYTDDLLSNKVFESKVSLIQ